MSVADPEFFSKKKGGGGGGEEICPLSIVVGVVIVVNLSCSEPLDQFQSNLGQSIIGWREMKDHALFQWGENIEIAKIYWQKLKIFF